MSDKDIIYRQAAVDALWKALFKCEDDMEKQFQESDELDINEWILHRIFIQNMSDIDRQTILNLPSAQPKQCSDCIANGGDWECDHIHCHKGQLPSAEPEQKKGKWIKMSDVDGIYWACSECGEDIPRVPHYDPQFDLFPRLKSIEKTNFCPNCGAKME